MMTFRNHRLSDYALPMSTSWLFGEIAEAKGKQEWFSHQSPQVLKALREAALIQSAESSNRIEGVTIAPERLRPLVLGKSKPRDRSEQEVQICPNVSLDMIRLLLQRLKGSRVQGIGRGQNARWIKLDQLGNKQSN